MDEPPGNFLGDPTADVMLTVGLFLTLNLVSAALAAALAGARTALHFAGLATPGELESVASEKALVERANQWLSESRLLTVAIQFCHTLVRVFAVVCLVGIALHLEKQNILLTVVIPGALVLVLSEAMFRLFARRYPFKALSRLNALIALVHGTVVPAARFLDGVNQRWRTAVGQSRISDKVLAQVIELASASAETVTEKDVVKGIVNFRTMNVRDLMKPREQISGLDAASNFAEVMDYVNRCGYSRIPVFRNSIDQIEGVLYIKDLLPFFGQGRDFPWVNVVRPGYFVGKDKKIDALLKDFQEKRVHIAVVRDGNENTLGLITLEDLIEVVIREINERSDDVDDHGYTRINERTFVFNGKTSIYDVFKLLDVEHPLFREPAEFESLEDFIVEINDELPQEGDELSYDQFTFVVEAVEHKRIKRVRVNVHAQA